MKNFRISRFNVRLTSDSLTTVAIHSWSANRKRLNEKSAIKQLKSKGRKWLPNLKKRMTYFRSIERSQCSQCSRCFSSACEFAGMLGHLNAGQIWVSLWLHACNIRCGWCLCAGPLQRLSSWIQWILSTAGALSAIRSYLQNRRVLFQSSKLIALRSVDRRIRRLSNCRELKGTGEHWSWGEFSLSSEVNRTEERTKENWRNREEAEFVRCVLQIGPGYLFRTDPCCRFAAVSVLSKLEWMRENERECTSYVLSWWERERGEY